MVDGSQNSAAAYRYDPFGNLISSSGTLASTNLYRFSSKECHTNSGMYYYLYRFYDPNLQRWINRDPIAGLVEGILGSYTDEDALPDFEVVEVSEGPNLFTFIGNRPLDNFDPYGLGYGSGSGGSYGNGNRNSYGSGNGKSYCCRACKVTCVLVPPSLPVGSASVGPILATVVEDDYNCTDCHGNMTLEHKRRVIIISTAGPGRVISEPSANKSYKYDRRERAR